MSGDKMTSFDESLSQALSARKYDVLTGRAPNIREIALSTMSSLYEKIIKPILDRIKFNLPNSVIGANANLLRNIFIAIGVILFVSVVFFMIQRKKRRSYRQKTMQEIFEDLKSNAITDEKLLQDASVLAKKGLYRDAIRYEYIALLWALNKHSIVYLTDYKTNSQIKYEILRNASPIHERFSDIVNIFNITWFGHKGVSEETYQKNRSGVNELIQEAYKYEKTA